MSGCCPEDVLQWLEEKKDEAVLAAAYAQVSNHAGRLLCLLEDSGREFVSRDVDTLWIKGETAERLGVDDAA